MRKGPAVAPGLGLDTDGSRALGPLLGGQDKTVEACLLSNPIEFDGIKTGIVDLFPEAEKLESVTIAQPIGDQVVRAFYVFVAGNVGQADVILVVHTGEADFAGKDFDLSAHD